MGLGPASQALEESFYGPYNRAMGRAGVERERYAGDLQRAGALAQLEQQELAREEAERRRMDPSFQVAGQNVVRMPGPGATGEQPSVALELPQRDITPRTDAPTIVMGEKTYQLNRSTNKWEEIGPAGARTSAGGGAGLTPVYGTDEEGNPVLMQMSPSGRAVRTELPPGVTPSTGVDRLDLGTGWALLDKRTGQIAGIVPKEGTIPPGFTVSGAGGERRMEPLAGSPAAREQRGQFVEAQTRLASVEDDINRLQGIAEDLLTHRGLPGAVGFQIGSSILPFTDAADFVARLDALKSQVGFSALQKMRDMSKTGGAVGQVSNYEQQLFQEQIDSLTRSQTEKQFKQALRNVIDFAERSKSNMRDAMRLQFGEVSSAGGAQQGGAWVVMTDPQGNEQEVHPDDVDNAETQGWTRK
jgi:hypothetical protein